MSEFSIKDAALTGFRFGREHPMAILVWAVISLVSTLLYDWITLSMAGQAMTQLVAIQEAQAADPMSVDPNAVFPIMGQVYSAMFVSSIPLLIAGALLTGAATRGVLKPNETAMGYVRFGADEVRLIIVLIVIGIILGLILMLGSVVASIIAVTVVVATGAGAPPTPEQIAGPLLTYMAPIMIVTGVLCLFLYGKFSMAPPLTLDRKAINIFSSFGMTKGLGGRIFRALLLAGLLYLIVGILGGAIVLGVIAAMTGDISQVTTFFTQPDMSSAAAFFTPLRLVVAVVGSVISALGAAIMLTPPATIYRALTEEGVDEVF